MDNETGECATPPVVDASWPRYAAGFQTLISTPPEREKNSTARIEVVTTTIITTTKPLPLSLPCMVPCPNSLLPQFTLCSNLSSSSNNSSSTQLTSRITTPIRGLPSIHSIWEVSSNNSTNAKHTTIPVPTQTTFSSSSSNNNNKLLTLGRVLTKVPFKPNACMHCFGTSYKQTNNATKKMRKCTRRICKINCETTRKVYDTSRPVPFIC
mmetsp:Transcript_3803/g.8532  ORF Transcript_3803/g.8532 Transcript_3803/m.8532 type:complete len:210 (+) Transcript_3803:2653-3282(+)